MTHLSAPQAIHRLVCALAVLLCGALHGTPASAKPKEVPVTLTPVKSSSALPEEFRSLLEGKMLPSNWDYFPRPGYPRDYERIGVEGEATVEFVVNAHGYVVYAHILEATDQQFGQSILDALGWHRPSREKPLDPSLPARYLIPVGFSIGDHSDTRDPSLVAKITTTAPLAKPLSFTKPFDHHLPRYPGMDAARSMIKKGMSMMQVVDTIGEPIVKTMHPNGKIEYGYGPDLFYPELIVEFIEKRVVRLTKGLRNPASKKRS